MIIALLQQIVSRKLPWRDLPLEQNIQLLKRAAPTLRQPKPAPTVAHQTDRAEQEARFPAPVRLVAVQHVGHGDSEDDVGQSLDGSGDGDGAPAQPRGRDLGDDDEADRADGHLVDEGPDVHQRGLRPDDGRLAAAEVEEADDEEDGRHEDHSGAVDRSAAELDASGEGLH